MKAIAYGKQTQRTFVVGEWVFFKLHQHRQQSVIARVCPKLAACYCGPFEILERVGVMAYHLKLPATAKIHPVFHVSLLKKAIRNYHAQPELPPGLEVEGTKLLESECQLASRCIMKKGIKIK
jgi:hypothetical protein